jgi:hypothetical protein
VSCAYRRDFRRLLADRANGGAAVSELNYHDDDVVVHEACFRQTPHVVTP